MNSACNFIFLYIPLIWKYFILHFGNLLPKLFHFFIKMAEKSKSKYKTRTKFISIKVDSLPTLLQKWSVVLIKVWLKFHSPFYNAPYCIKCSLKWKLLLVHHTTHYKYTKRWGKYYTYIFSKWIMKTKQKSLNILH